MYKHHNHAKKGMSLEHEDGLTKEVRAESFCKVNRS